jgi:hypothetical protein
MAPRRPPRQIQQLQTRSMRPGSEEVQVQVRGRDGLVAHPGLDRSRVDAAGQPEAGRGVAQVVEAAAVTGAAPVHGAHCRRPVELGTTLSGEEQVPGSSPSAIASTRGSTRLASGTRRDRRPLVDFVATPSGAARRIISRGWAPASDPRLRSLALRSSADPSRRARAGSRRGAGSPGASRRTPPQLLLGERRHLRRDGRLPGHAHAGDGVGQDVPLSGAPREEGRQARSVTHRGALGVPAADPVLEAPGDLS